MRRPSRLLLLPLVLVGTVGAAGCGGVTNKTESRPVATTSAPTGTSGTALSIKGFAYDPNPLTVAPGATIDVTNSDSATHDVTSDEAGLFRSGDADKGKTVSFKAPTKPGTYSYVCSYHGNMKGSLIVK